MLAFRFLSSFLTLLSIVHCLKNRDSKYWKNIAKKSNNGIIEIKNDDSFSQLIFEPRDYSVAILLTVMDPNFDCATCKLFDPYFRNIAATWKKQHPDFDDFYFATTDYKINPTTFQKLAIQSAPTFLIYPPTKNSDGSINSRTDPFKYKFVPNSLSHESVLNFINNSIGIKIVIKESFNYKKFFKKISLTGLTLITIFIFKKQIFKIITNKTVWAATSLATILIIISGYMFNSIKSTPYTGGNEKDGIQYIASGLQMQFVMESNLISLLYAILGFTVIGLTTKIPTIKIPALQTILIFLTVAVMAVTYSYLLSILRHKIPSYPFSLPPFSIFM